MSQLPKKHAGGRPPLYTIELGKKICAELSRNLFGLEALCKSRPDFPSHETVYEWLRSGKYPEFSDIYAQSRRDQCDYSVDQALIIANEMEDVNRARLIIDTIKWKACKLAPKIYGERTQTDMVLTVKQADAIEELE